MMGWAICGSLPVRPVVKYDGCTFYSGRRKRSRSSKVVVAAWYSPLCDWYPEARSRKRIGQGLVPALSRRSTRLCDIGCPAITPRGVALLVIRFFTRQWGRGAGSLAPAGSRRPTLDRCLDIEAGRGERQRGAGINLAALYASIARHASSTTRLDTTTLNVTFNFSCLPREPPQNSAWVCWT